MPVTLQGRKIHRSIARQLKSEGQEDSSPVSPVFVSQQLQQGGPGPGYLQVA